MKMDENVTFSNKMERDVGAVILINKFDVGSEDVDQFLKTWASGAEFMKKQPGFISAQLHRGIGGSSGCAIN
jgi:hypothetical protein